ncbi:MAG: NAD(P)H-dependent oxidoreductase [Anaerolineae bacterium]|nr:NAD(P)H-dependent oxidoreductase [Anaerolineae bacterium]
MELLHLVATPRSDGSNTLRISNAVIDCLKEKYPDLKVTTIDLFHADVPAMAGNKIDTKYMIMQGGELKPSMISTWSDIESYILGFMRADMYLISAPMWNLSIPYALKYYIDTIVQPGYLFKYLPDGTPVGLASGKMIVVKTSGGNYAEPPLKFIDFHEPYLRGIFGFCGITDIQFISAYLMDITPELREININNAIEQQIPSVVANI